MISVIVPVYNIESYIERCITSILNQTNKEFELLLIDDGSVDGSGKICDKYERIDSRVKVIHKINGGLSDARNMGTGLAKGEWITYIDGDDYVEPEYLEELLNLCTKNGVKVSVVCERIRREGNQKEKSKQRQNAEVPVKIMKGREAAEEIVHYNKAYMIYAWGKLYHRSLIPILSYPYRKIHEDEFVTYKVLYETKEVAVSPKQYYNYVVRKDSITKQAYSISRLNKLEALKEAITYFDKKKDMEFVAHAKLRYFLNLQIAWYRVKHSPTIDNKQLVIKALLDERRTFFQKEKIIIWRTASLLEKTTILTFQVHPAAYGWLSSIVLYIQSNGTR